MTIDDRISDRSVALPLIQGDMQICICALHCALSPDHETACCRMTTCPCWCHRKEPTQ